jgi:large subunit ribosomal protein L5
VPRVTKVVVNMGIGDAIQDGKAMDAAVDELAGISGQKPTVTRARKSIANFKLREGMAIGCCVTLRGKRMYEFLERLTNLALPRVRDFRGANPRGFDGRGNYTLGIRDQLIFPEVNYAKVQKVKGMNVCIVTTARTDEEARALLAGLGMPFRKN